MNIRVCKDLQNNTVYESYKYCDCDHCMNNLKNRKTVNKATITTYDKNKIEDMKIFLNSWNCKKADSTSYKKVTNLTDSKIYYYNI